MKFKFTPRQRKWIKRLAILFVIRLVLGAILYYVIVYRFKDIAQIMVKRQSKGMYAFDASDVEFSIWHKNIVVSDAVLHCTDTLRRPTHYEVTIPRIYLSIESWTALLLHRRMLVDSLNIDSPDIIAHAHSPQLDARSRQLERAGRVSFHASQVFDVLKQVLAHLQVRAFSLEKGSFRYSNTKTGIPFVSDQINLSIRNFSKKDSTADHLFSSDDVDISLGPQHWMMPDGNHDLQFKRLHFSGRNEIFELDSCTFHSAAEGNRGDLSLSADKFFFNATNLSATYERERLLIDTLICIRPVLSLQLVDRQQREDSTVAINKSIRHLFIDISFRYIDIRDGQLRLGHSGQNRETYTQQTNLKVYNLRISPDSLSAIRTDSIAMNLRNIRFLGPDSLSQLSIGELTLIKQDLTLREAVFGPAVTEHGARYRAGRDRSEQGHSSPDRVSPDRASSDRSDTVLTLSSPLIEMRGCSLQDLLKRKLKADTAILYDPILTLTSKAPRSSADGGEDQDHPRTWGPEEKADKWRREQFDKSVHNLRLLIDVNRFEIGSQRKRKIK